MIYNVNFTKIICVGMPHRLNILQMFFFFFFFFFFMNFHFLACFRKIVKNFFIKMTAHFLPVCSKYPKLYIL